MPWCVRCARFLSPSTVRPDGTCPACGRAVDPGRARPPAPTPPGPKGTGPTAVSISDVPEGRPHARRAAAHEAGHHDHAAQAPVPEPSTDHGDDQDGDEELPPVPWHLKALGAGLVVYLGYRSMQALEWVWGRFG